MKRKRELLLIPLLLLLDCFSIGVVGLLSDILHRGASVFAWMTIIPVIIIALGAIVGFLLLAINYTL